MDTDIDHNLIIYERIKEPNSNIRFFFGISIFLCILSYILVDVDIYNGYEIIVEKNETIKSEYKYIFLTDSLYALVILSIYIYIICTRFNYYYLYIIIQLIYLSNILYHFISSVIIINILKKYKYNTDTENGNVAFFCFSVIFNIIMSYFYNKNKFNN